MFLKIFILMGCILFGSTHGFGKMETVNVKMDKALINKFLRLRRASEGGVTDFGGKITIDENAIGGERQPDGTICFKKVIFVNETEFDRGQKCHHRLKNKCHLTYITDYHSSPMERCETTFQKDCHITFKPVPHVENVTRCHVPYETKCGDEIVGPEKCRIVSETFCETTYKEYNIEQDVPNCTTVEELRCTTKPIELLHLPHAEDKEPFAQKERCEKWPVQKCEIDKKDVKKVHPNTECKKVARKVCAPSNCNVFPGPEICVNEKNTLVQRIPEEDCDLQPQKHCRTQSTLVPKLIPKKNCVKVPKEICVNTRTNPRTIRRPVVKNWCFDPRELKDEVEE